MVASPAPPIRDLACNPGMCPNWDLNWRPFDSQAGAQSTEPQQPGLFHGFEWKVKGCSGAAVWEAGKGDFHVGPGQRGSIEFHVVMGMSSTRTVHDGSHGLPLSAEHVKYGKSDCRTEL